MSQLSGRGAGVKPVKTKSQVFPKRSFEGSPNANNANRTIQGNALQCGNASLIICNPMHVTESIYGSVVPLAMFILCLKTKDSGKLNLHPHYKVLAALSE